MAPRARAASPGPQLPISENEDLYTLIGTTYGGDGQETFALPDLTGRAPIHQGNGYVLAERGGRETVTLTVGQLPAHGYDAIDGEAASNIGGVAARRGRYVEGPADGHVVGGSQPHENRTPYLGIQYIISLHGVIPTPT